MKSYELKPTKENLCKAYLEDMVGRNEDIKSFAVFLNSLSDCCSIAVDGCWGSGKTFFVKQVKMFMDAQNDFIATMDEDDKRIFKDATSNDNCTYRPQVSVYYDAWENDNDSDPVLSLVYSIMSNVDTDFSLKTDDGCIKKAASILEFFSGKNWTDLAESFKGEDLLEDIRKNKNVEDKIKDFLDSLLEERGDRLIIFIDELDRCKPSYAVKLLERIKHYFTNDRFTFVFSINATELQHTIKRFYGNDFDACRYLDRFFDLRVSLPPANKSRYLQSIHFPDSSYKYDSVCRAVIDYFDLSYREMSKYIRLSKIAAYAPTHESKQFNFLFPDGQARLFCLLHIVPVMIGLKLFNTIQYDAFISGKDGTPLLDVMNRLQNHNWGSLLNQNETFNENALGKVYVTAEYKLREVYEAIFVTIYSGNNYHTIIGEYEFDADTKNWLLRVVSLLSPYATFDE